MQVDDENAHGNGRERSPRERWDPPLRGVPVPGPHAEGLRLLIDDDGSFPSLPASSDRRPRRARLGSGPVPPGSTAGRAPVISGRRSPLGITDRHAQHDAGSRSFLPRPTNRRTCPSAPRAIGNPASDAEPGDSRRPWRAPLFRKTRLRADGPSGISGARQGRRVLPRPPPGRGAVISGAARITAGTRAHKTCPSAIRTADACKAGGD
jgi:hypothetical protein